MRSSYKVPFVSKSTFNLFIKRKRLKGVNKKMAKFISARRTKIPLHLLFWNKSSRINKSLISNRKIGIYNGKLFMYINLNKYSLGFKLGELVLTRRTVKHKKKIIKKQKLVKKGDLKKNIGFAQKLALKKYLKKDRIKKWV